MSVSLGKLGLRLQSSNSNGKLGHWMQVLWQAVQQLLNVLRQLRSGSQIGRQCLHLALSWHFTGQQQPKDGFWQWLITISCLWQLLLDVWNGTASESDTFFWVQNRTFPNKTLDTTHTTVCLFQQHFTNHGLTVFLLQLLDFLSLFWENLSKPLLQSLFPIAVTTCSNKLQQQLLALQAVVGSTQQSAC